MNSGPAISLWLWLLAVSPIALLVGLVVRGTMKTVSAALTALALALAIGVVEFGAGPTLLAVASGKGIFTGIWILYVIWPALLLFLLAKRAGLTTIGDKLTSLFPRNVDNVLLVAWILPSFIQGVAGFGTPIAVAAPLLIAMRIPVVTALALPLIGYHWSVTFGSMGSSFYTGALTANLRGNDITLYALDASLLLGVNVLVSGLLVCVVYGGRSAVREGLRMVLVTGAIMAATMIAVARIEPSVAALSAGAAGLAVSEVRRRHQLRSPALTAPVTVPVDSARRSADPAGEGAGDMAWARVFFPYGILLLLALAAFVPPPSREWVRNNLLFGPSFDATSTSYGVVNAAVDRHSAIALLGHPGSYILAAALAGYVGYRRLGLVHGGTLRSVSKEWLRTCLKSSGSVLALTTLAAVLVDTGMIRLAANGVATISGASFPLLAPVLGALGSFTTGSSTTSNALLAGLQRDVAEILDIPVSALVAGQTAGANVGNALAPVVILVGASAVGAESRVGEVIRRVFAPMMLLLALVAVGTLIMSS